MDWGGCPIKFWIWGGMDLDPGPWGGLELGLKIGPVKTSSGNPDRPVVPQISRWHPDTWYSWQARYFPDKCWRLVIGTSSAHDGLVVPRRGQWCLLTGRCRPWWIGGTLIALWCPGQADGAPDWSVVSLTGLAMVHFGTIRGNSLDGASDRLLVPLMHN